MRILLIEDESKLAKFIERGLKEEGYQITVQPNGSQGTETAAIQQFDLILLDIMLPGQSGFEVLKNLREFAIETPVIFMSALSESDHVIKGLDLGATDYIKKPFDFEELKARIRNATRKTSSSRASRLEIEDLKVDLINREVSRAGMDIELSKREFSLLQLLLQNVNRVVSKTEITEKIWDVQFDMSSNVVEVHLHQLRKKLDHKHEHKLIETKVGFGYRISGDLKTY